ncbi:MAG TPA: hypothetical protein PKY96_07645, partial [Flavobacteriales bacterium]|nr:hypothetical protein [Flavobacteriales bacterium]
MVEHVIRRAREAALVLADGLIRVIELVRNIPAPEVRAHIIGGVALEVQADGALRIVHIDQEVKPVGKKKHDLTKTEQRTLRRGFELYLEALTAKLARKRKHKPKNEEPL